MIDNYLITHVKAFNFGLKLLPTSSDLSKIAKIQHSKSFFFVPKIMLISLKMIFLFQYMNSRITFIKVPFHLLEICKTLFSKNMP